MADKIRRIGKSSRRMGASFEKTGERSPSSFMAPDRRRTDRNLGRLLRTGDPYAHPETPIELRQVQPDYGQDRRIGEDGPSSPANERRKNITDRRSGVERRHGAGRRSGDLSRALDTGESVIFDMSKVKSAGKLAKKAAKKLPAIGVAVGVYDLVNRSKQ